MNAMRPIEIDLDVYKRLVAEQREFDEPFNGVLRRLLGIDACAATVAIQEIGSSGRAWSGKGVTLPHGTRLRMEYNGREHSGHIDNGEWLLEGSRFKSPSAAAGGVAKTRSGNSPSLDGWIYWQIKRPGERKWVMLGSLREESREAVKADLLS
jgi:hypothetical protein